MQAARESLEQEVSGPARPEAPVQAAGECAAVTRGGVEGHPLTKAWWVWLPGKGWPGQSRSSASLSGRLPMGRQGRDRPRGGPAGSETPRGQ